METKSGGVAYVTIYKQYVYTWAQHQKQEMIFHQILHMIQYAVAINILITTLVATLVVHFYPIVLYN